VYIREDLICNIVVLDPVWLGSNIFGPSLLPNSSVVPHLKSVTGVVKLNDISRVYPKWNSLSIARLFEHFELCTVKDQDGKGFEFPCLINAEKLYGLWERDLSLTIYAGIRIFCQTDNDIFSSGLFPLIQLRLRKVFNQGFDDQELALWSDGLKCCRGEVEIIVEHSVPGKVIEVCVRGNDGSNRECYTLLQQFYSVIAKTIGETNPGTMTLTGILSPIEMRQHKKHFCYSRLDLFEAQRGDGYVRRSKEGSNFKENIVDLICCGCQDTLATVKSVPYLPLKTISKQIRTRLSCLLDQPHPLGQDWCLLILALGLADDTQDVITSHSPTDCLLQLYENSSCNANVAGLVDALKAIDRLDAVEVLVEGLPLFTDSFSSNIFVNVPGVEMTSYSC